VKAEKPIKFTEHAVRRLLDLDLLEEDVVRVIREGKRVQEGRAKLKATLRSKRGLVIAVCAEYPDHIQVITVSKRR